jgi:hypothetical protein
MHYDQLIWIHLGEIIAEYLNSSSQDLIPREELSSTSSIYNIPTPLLLLHIKDKLTRNAFFILMQEIKCDIFHR